MCKSSSCTPKEKNCNYTNDRPNYFLYVASFHRTYKYQVIMLYTHKSNMILHAKIPLIFKFLI